MSGARIRLVTQAHTHTVYSSVHIAYKHNHIHRENRPHIVTLGEGKIKLYKIIDEQYCILLELSFRLRFLFIFIYLFIYFFKPHACYLVIQAWGFPFFPFTL